MQTVNAENKKPRLVLAGCKFFSRDLCNPPVRTQFICILHQNGWAYGTICPSTDKRRCLMALGF
jgi:hypothetical protein